MHKGTRGGGHWLGSKGAVIIKRVFHQGATEKGGGKEEEGK